MERGAKTPRRVQSKTVCVGLRPAAGRKAQREEPSLPGALEGRGSAWSGHGGRLPDFPASPMWQ